MGQDTIPAFPLEVAVRYTTNLFFPFSINSVDLGSENVIGKKGGKKKNVLLLKAARSGFPETNVSVYLDNGAFYSFRVRFVDSLSVFNYSFGCAGAVGRILFSDWPVDKGRMEEDAAKVVAVKSFLNVRAASGKICVGLRGVYLKDGLLWLGLCVRNGSSIDFVPEMIQCRVEERKRLRRTAVQSMDMQPLYVPEDIIVAGRGTNAFSIGFVPFTPAEGKRLVIEISGGKDERRVRLAIPRKLILKARIFNER